MKNILIILFILSTCIYGHAQKHDVFKVAHSCDSISITDQLMGVWVDTLNPFHQLVFSGLIITEERISAYDTATGEANWYIVQGSVTSGAACEFTIFITGYNNPNKILNFQGRTRCALVDNTIFVVGVSAPDQHVYRRKK